jgi:hypothetical protein
LPTGTRVTRARGCPGPSTAQVTTPAAEEVPAAARFAEGGGEDDADGGTEEGTEDGKADGAEAEADGPGVACTGWLAEADALGGASACWLAEDGADPAKEGSTDRAVVGTACWSAVGSAAVRVWPAGWAAVAAEEKTCAEAGGEAIRAGPPPMVTTTAVAVPPAITAAATKTTAARGAVRLRRVVPARMRSNAPGRAVTGRTASSSRRVSRSGLSGGVMTIP